MQTTELFTKDQEQGLESRSLDVVKLETVERILFTYQSLHPELNLRTARELVIQVMKNLKDGEA
jgi:hypothetical protein